MKTIMTILLSIMALVGFSNTVSCDFMDKINVYRNYNGASNIVWDSTSAEISKTHTAYMIITDTMVHSGSNTSENIAYGEMFIDTDTSGGFNHFLKDVYGVSTNDISDNDIIITYIVYSWSKSYYHNVNLLSSYFNSGSAYMIYSDVKIINNNIFTNSKTIEFKVSATFNLIR